jgi:hypothetical protein
VSIEDKIKHSVREIVELLVSENYIKLENMNKIGILTANEVERAILNYGEKLTLPPNDAYDCIDIFKLDNPKEFVKEFSIDFELWANNSKSDLTLSCEATVDVQDNVIVSLYSVHVL